MVASQPPAGQEHGNRPVPGLRLRPAADYDRSEMTMLLAAGARYQGDTGYQAAIWLLTFTGLPGTKVLAPYVSVDVRTYQDRRIAVALIDRDAWPPLLADKHLDTTDWRLLLLAESLATARPVDLDEALCNMGHAHARRIAEAMLIRTGNDRFYTLDGTAALAGLKAMQAGLSDG